MKSKAEHLYLRPFLLFYLYCFLLFFSSYDNGEIEEEKKADSSKNEFPLKFFYFFSKKKPKEQPKFIPFQVYRISRV